jgi:3-oxoacyl-[acyl-carrier protein] reductase
MDLMLKGKIALVTASSAGIGRETAKVLAEEGAQTVVVARRKDALIELADEIVSKGGLRPQVIVDDVTTPGAADRVREKVVAEQGHLDILINNLGQARTFGLTNPDSDWEEAFNLNFVSARKLAEAFIEEMQARKFGRIINMTSTLEPFGMSGSHTSKAALLVWSKGLSRLVAKDDVTVNCISPGILVTDQIRNHFLPKFAPTAADQQAFLEKEIPAGHFGEPADAAQLIAFLCSPKAGYITGQRVCVDGGWYRHI